MSFTAWRPQQLVERNNRRGIWYRVNHGKWNAYCTECTGWETGLEEDRILVDYKVAFDLTEADAEAFCKEWIA